MLSTELQRPTPPAPAPTTAQRATESALTLLLRIKRLQLLRDNGQLVDTLLVCLEMQRELIARVEQLEAEITRLRPGKRRSAR